MATSESYTTKAAAKNGIESVKTNAPKALTEVIAAPDTLVDVRARLDGRRWHVAGS